MAHAVAWRVAARRALFTPEINNVSVAIPMSSPIFDGCSWFAFSETLIENLAVVGYEHSSELVLRYVYIITVGR